jgi:hypothetical protein
MCSRGGLVLAHYLDGDAAAAGAKDHVDSSHNRACGDTASGAWTVRLRYPDSEGKIMEDTFIQSELPKDQPAQVPPMTERERLAMLRINIGLFACQFLTAGLAIGVDEKFAVIAPMVSGAQTYFNNLWKSK